MVPVVALQLITKFSSTVAPPVTVTDRRFVPCTVQFPATPASCTHQGHPKNEYANNVAVMAAREQRTSEGIVESGFGEWLETHQGPVRGLRSRRGVRGAGGEVGEWRAVPARGERLNGLSGAHEEPLEAGIPPQGEPVWVAPK